MSTTTTTAVAPLGTATDAAPAPMVSHRESDTERFIKQRITAEQWDNLPNDLQMRQYRLSWLCNNRSKWRAPEVARLGYIIGIEPIELVLQYGFGWEEIRVDELAQVAGLGGYDLAYGPKTA